jgi:hypothetical protein
MIRDSSTYPTFTVIRPALHVREGLIVPSACFSPVRLSLCWRYRWLKVYVKLRTDFAVSFRVLPVMASARVEQMSQIVTVIYVNAYQPVPPTISEGKEEEAILRFLTANFFA